MERTPETTRAINRSRKFLAPKRSINTYTRPFSPHLQTILGETENTLREIYGDRFLGLVLFGSYARGSAIPGSDVDLILLLRESVGLQERANYSEAIAELSLRHDTVISLVPMGIQEFQNNKTPLLLNVRREGIRL